MEFRVQSDRRETCWVSRIKEHESWKGFQEVIWLTCFTAGDQWNLPRLTTVWGYRLHNAPNLLVQVCSSLSLTERSLAATLSVFPTSVSRREQGFVNVRPHFFY